MPAPTAPTFNPPAGDYQVYPLSVLIDGHQGTSAPSGPFSIAPPVLDPWTGIVPLSVTLSSPQGFDLIYTTNLTLPTLVPLNGTRVPSGTVLNLTVTTTLLVVATDGTNISVEVPGEYRTLTQPPPPLPRPQVTPVFGSVPLPVRLQTQPQYQIIYTLDNTHPSLSNGTTVGPDTTINITTPCNLRAVTTDGTNISIETPGTYSLPLPTFNIRWTNDGSDPGLNHGNQIFDDHGTVSIGVPGTTLKAVVINTTDNTVSPIASALYTGNQNQLQLTAPIFQPSGGEFQHFPVPVTIDGAQHPPVQGETIRYTLDGTIPTPTHGQIINSDNGPVPGGITAPGTTLKAICIAGNSFSTVTSATYTGVTEQQPPPPPPPRRRPPFTAPGGFTFQEAAPMICGVVDNGVCSDDSRVLVRLNEATKIILDMMIPVGGMATYDVVTTGIAGNTTDSYLLLPPQLENAIEVMVLDSSVYGDTDIREGWYEIISQSTYVDPGQQHDNPLVDQGLVPDPLDPYTLRRKFLYPGLAPNAHVRVTGAKRFIPLAQDTDFLIVQNIEAIKCVILSIERYENNDPDGAQKYRASGLEILQGEVKKHILDPRNYMRRKAAYQEDLINFPESTLGWTRANIALDIDLALRAGRMDLTWSINQMERRIMQAGLYKDCIESIRAEVVGGQVYMPINVQSVLAVSLDGRPIPIRSQFFEQLENGPGAFSCSDTLIDQGEVYFAAAQKFRRLYRLNADCSTTRCLTAVVKLRWLPKQPADMMVIKNYEAMRLMMTAKFLEEKEDWQNAQINQQQAFQIMEKELRDYLAGIRHTVHIQTYGFGLGDVGGFWSN